MNTFRTDPPIKELINRTIMNWQQHSVQQAKVQATSWQRQYFLCCLFFLYPSLHLLFFFHCTLQQQPLIDWIASHVVERIHRSRREPYFVVSTPASAAVEAPGAEWERQKFGSLQRKRNKLMWLICGIVMLWVLKIFLMDDDHVFLIS